MMNTSPTAEPRPLPSPAAPWPMAMARPVGHLVCDLQGHVSWTDDLAAAMLADAQVLLVQADGRLGVRSHRVGLLALRSAMRLAVLGTPAELLALRHGLQELQVGVHALPDAADGRPRVLLSLRPLNPESPRCGPRNFRRT
jgi:hypothetical protein